VTRSEYIEARDRIFEQECRAVLPALLARIKDRVAAEMPGATFVEPRRWWPYAKEFGAKSLPGHLCDPKVCESTMVLPLGSVEWPNERGAGP
jgi:hypothetical protein